MKPNYILFPLVFFAVSTGAAQRIFSAPNFNAPLHRPYTQKNLSPFLLEAEYHRMIRSQKSRSFIFPRACVSELDSSRICSEHFKLSYSTSDTNAQIQGTPLIAYEYRYLNEEAHTIDFGLIMNGHKGPLSFFLDTRMFTEKYDSYYHDSYDREFVERQDESATDADFTYSSYSRYRSNISYDFSWGRFVAAHDAVHWGPGLFSNLNFHQNAVPFNYITYSTNLGPFSIISLYGTPLYENQRGGQIENERALYAHRYEVRPFSNFLFGITEQLTLYNSSEPFAFVPVVPLFMHKGLKNEKFNNGNIGFDVSYRLPQIGHIYSEFLIDDIQSPSSLFNDFWGNKWGWMIGLHGILNRWLGLQSGYVIEYSRLEPWIYTHYIKNSAQAGSGGFPLGNQLGPNSQSIKGKVYIRKQNWYGGIRFDADWKGTDLGSNLQDNITNEAENKPKKFIGGIDPDISGTLYAFYTWRWLRLFGECKMRSDVQGIFRIQLNY